MTPGIYAFCTGADDLDGAYARDVGVVPTEPIRAIPAGSRIRYRAAQMVYGNAGSGWEPMALERERWAIVPLEVLAEVGEVVSDFPPEVKAANGAARFTVGGGTDWVPVRVTGLDASKPLRVRQTDETGTRELGPGAPGEPWYNTWPADDGSMGATFLVRMPEHGGTRLEARQ